MKTIEKMADIFTDEMISRGFFGIASSPDIDFDGDSFDMSKLVVRNDDGTVSPISERKPVTADSPKPNGSSTVMNVDHEKKALSVSGQAYPWIENGVCKFYGIFADNELGRELLPVAKDGGLRFSIDALEDKDDGTILILGISPVWMGSNAAAQSILQKFVNVSRKGTKEMSKEVEKKLTPEEYDALVAEIKENFVEGNTEEATEEADAAANQAEPTEKEAEGEPAPAVEKTISKKVVFNSFNLANGKQFAKSVEKSLKDIQSSEAYTKAYADAWLENRGDKAGIAKSLRVSDVTKDITLDPANLELLPEYFITQIDELMKSDGSLFATFTKAPGKILVGSPVKSASSAKGRTRVITDKPNQVVNISPRVHYPKMLYKILRIPAEFVDLNSIDGNVNSSAFLQYAMAELPQKVIAAMEQAATVGGVITDAATPARFTGSISIMDDALGTTANGGDTIYASVYTPEATDTAFNALFKAVRQVRPTLFGGSMNRVMMIGEQDLTDVQLSNQLLNTNGAPFAGVLPLDYLTSALGLSKIVTPAWLWPDYTPSFDTDHNAEIDNFIDGYSAMIYDANSLRYVGNASPQTLSDYTIFANSYDTEAKILFGSMLYSPKSAVVVARPAEAPAA